MKAIKWIVLAVVILIVGGVTIVLFRLDAIVRSTIETQSQKQLNVPVTLAGADVGIFGGTVGLNEYSIGSPKGFPAESMFSVADLNVAVAYSQLNSDPIRIQSIDIEKPMLVLEQNAGKFNIQALMEQLAPAEPTTTPETEPIRLIIDKLRINGATVALRPGDLSGIPVLGAMDLKKLDIKEEYKLTLPTIDIANIGTADGAQNGAAIKDVVTQVIKAMAEQAAKSPELPEPVRMVLSGNLDAVGDMMKQQVQQRVGAAVDDLTKKLPGDAGKAIDQTLKDVTSGNDPGKAIEKGIGGFLDKKKDDKKDDKNQAPVAPQKAPTH